SGCSRLPVADGPDDPGTGNRGVSRYRPALGSSCPTRSYYCRSGVAQREGYSCPASWAPTIASSLASTVFNDEGSIPTLLNSTPWPLIRKSSFGCSCSSVSSFMVDGSPP